MFRLVGELLSYWNVLRVQVWVELKLSVANTKLGYLWWLLDPLLLMATYYFVMHIVFERGDPDYHIFILCGIVSWQWFSRALSHGVTAFTRNRSLIKQTSTPLPIYILAPILIQMVFALFGFAIVILFAFNISFPEILLLIPLLFLQVVLTFGLACFLSTINVYFPDTQHFIVYGLRLCFYLSPILYSSSRIQESERIPDLFKTLFFCNPFATIIPAYREVLMHGQFFPWQYPFLWMIIALILLQIGLTVVRAQHQYIPKML